jgi:hypothetical protein
MSSYKEKRQNYDYDDVVQWITNWIVNMYATTPVTFYWISLFTSRIIEDRPDQLNIILLYI